MLHLPLFGSTPITGPTTIGPIRQICNVCNNKNTFFLNFAHHPIYGSNLLIERVVKGQRPFFGPRAKIMTTNFNVSLAEGSRGLCKEDSQARQKLPEICLRVSQNMRTGVAELKVINA
jgi:hypothetical protein